MFPVATLLVSVLLALLAWETDPVRPAPKVWMAAFGVLVPVLSAGAEAWWQVRVRQRRAKQCHEGGSAGPEEGTERSIEGEPPRAAAARVRLSALVGWVWVLFGAGWAGFARTSPWTDWVLLDEMLLMAPLPFLWFMSWVGEIAVYRAAGYEVPLRAHLGWRGRTYGFPAVPLIALVAVVDVIRVLGWMPVFESFAYLSWGTLAVGVVLLFVASPWLVRAVLPSEPLPPGRVRDIVVTLEGADARAVRRVRVWKTGGRYVNAAIVGLSRRWQTILLSDALLKVLPPSEVAAVYAHERAHGTNGHAVLFLLLAMAFVVGFYPVSEMLPPDPLVGGGAAAAFAAVYWLGLFGWVSRRVEREADLDGAVTVGRADPMILALARIRAMVGGKEGWLATWRHFSTDRRIAALTDLVRDPSHRARARRTRERLTGLAVAMLVVAVGAAALRVPRDHLEGRMLLALEQERYTDYEKLAGRAESKYPNDPWLTWLDALASARQGRTEEAVTKIERMLALDPPSVLRREAMEALRELEAQGSADESSPAQPVGSEPVEESMEVD